MPSRKFNELPPEEKRRILKQLYERYDSKCLFCEKKIDDPSEYTDISEYLKTHEVDHIIPLASPESMDDDSNWAILHRTCNRKKGEKPLYLAKRIYKFQEDKKRFGEKFTLGKVLEVFNIHPKEVRGF